MGAGLIGGLVVPGRSLGSSPGNHKVSRPKNVVFLISDGMSTGVLDLAEQFSWLMRGRGTHWAALMAKPDSVLGMQETHSLDSPVTDSAAASAAWGTGCRGFNGMLNVFPDGRQVTPIARVFKEAGGSVGLISTATITHATPAGFAACVPNRSMEAEIARQYLEAEIDILLGGGAEFFDPKDREDGADLFASAAEAGYSVCRSKEEFEALGRSAPKLLGTFGRGFLPYTIDAHNDTEAANSTPTLKQMTQQALPRLARNPRGFLCQIEGARVDHAAHNNDAAGMLWDQLAFDDALGATLDFASKNGETLIIVTSDHGNANPGLNGWSKAYSGSGDYFKQLRGVKASASRILAWTKGALRTGDIDGFGAGFERLAGFRPTDEEQQILIEAASGNATPNWSKQLANFMGLYGQISGNWNGIGWTGVTHTSDHTILTATGPGREAFAGLHRNDAVFERLCEVLGVQQNNKPWSGPVDKSVERLQAS